MTSEYVCTTIGEVCSVGDGAHTKVTRQNFGVPYLTSKNIGSGFLKLDDVDFISEEDFEKLFPKNSKATRRLKPGDVLIGIIGTFGNAYRYKEIDHFGVSSSVAILRSNQSVLNPNFLFYVVTSNSFKQAHLAYKSGSVQGYTNIPTIKCLPIPLPPLPEQKAIAHILGTLDDKIELNQQMNRNLEAIASAIFKSWFVDFDPVRAKVEGQQPIGMDAATAALFPDSFEDSPLGEIPKGWRVGKVEDWGEVICGKTPPTNNPENYGEEMPFITIPDMHGRVFALETGKYLSIKGIQAQPSKTLPAYSICVSCIATPGLVVITSQPSQTNQQINSVVPTNKSAIFYCYFALRRLADEIRARGSGGSVFSNLNKGQFAALPVLIPLQELVINYQQLVEGLFKKLLTNEKESRTLATIRDTLLPKLMSGEIRVKEAEKIVEAVA
jgi:type I restriction enzyme S subunit